METSCPCPTAEAPPLSSVGCFMPGPTRCVHEVTVASAVTVMGMQCMDAPHVPSRGFFVVSRGVSGEVVCTEGDAYHATVAEVSGRSHFSALSQPFGGAPAVYWLNTSSGAPAGLNGVCPR